MAFTKLPKLRNLIERSWPLLFSAAVGGIYYFSSVTFPDQALSSLLSSTISISAILMGFLGTSKAILLSYSSKKLGWLKSKPEMWQRLIGFFKASFLANFLLCICTLLLLSGVLGSSLSDVCSWINLPRALYAIWVALTLYAITSFYRVIDIFFVLLRNS